MWLFLFIYFLILYVVCLYLLSFEKESSKENELTRRRPGVEVRRVRPWTRINENFWARLCEIFLGCVLNRIF